LQVFHGNVILSLFIKNTLRILPSLKSLPTSQLDSATAVRLHRALNASEGELLAIVQEEPPEIVAAALKNRSLSEVHLAALLKRKELPEGLLKDIGRNSLVMESHQLKVALAQHRNLPAPQLLPLLPHLYLFELHTLCILPGTTPDQQLAAERAIIQRLPTTPLGNKMTLARRATAAVLEALLKEGNPLTVELCLANPRLKEGAIFQFLRSGNASAECISLVARNPRWQSRPNLREAILTNPRTPLVWFTLWLPGLGPGELKKLLSSHRLGPQQRKVVEERLSGRH
jgi:hypothetical protein